MQACDKERLPMRKQGTGSTGTERALFYLVEQERKSDWGGMR